MDPTRLFRSLVASYAHPFIIAGGESIVTHWTDIIRKVCSFSFFFFSVRPTKIELQRVSRTFETFSRARFARSESGLISRGPVSRTRPRSARVPVDNTLLHQLSRFLSPPSFLSLRFFSSPPFDLRFHLGPLFLPPRPSLSLSLSFSLASLLPFDLRFLALPRLNSPLRLLEASLPPSAVFSPFLRLGARFEHRSCYNPESADGRPMYGSLFYAGRAALRCTPRALLAERCGSKPREMYPPRLSLSLLNNRPHVTRWPLVLATLLFHGRPKFRLENWTVGFLKKGIKMEISVKFVQVGRKFRIVDNFDRSV